MYSKLDRGNTSKVQHGTTTPDSATRGNLFLKDGSSTLYGKDASTGTWFSVASGSVTGIFEEGTATGSAQRTGSSLDALGEHSFLMGPTSTLTANADYSFLFGYGSTTDSSNSIVLGSTNTIGSSSLSSAVIGKTNEIGDGSSYSLSLGYNNTIGDSCLASVAIGSTLNLGNSSGYCFLSGQGNSISTSPFSSVLGTGNSISDSDYSFAGGVDNIISFTSDAAAIFGNANEVIYASESLVVGNGNIVEKSNYCVVGGNTNQLGYTEGSTPSAAMFGYDNEDYGSGYSLSVGLSNLITGGTANVITGGYNNIYSSSYCFMGGYSNNIHNDHSVVFGIDNNVESISNVNNAYCLVRGREANAIWPGAHFFSGHALNSVPGDSQCMTSLSLIAQTVGATTETMMFDLSDTISPLYIKDGHVQSYRLSILASDTGTTGAILWDFPVIVWRNDPDMAIEYGGTVPSAALSQGTLSVTVAFSKDATYDRIEVDVTGEAGKTVNWQAHIYAGCDTLGGLADPC